MRTNASPDAMHAIALIDLTWPDSDGKSLGRSISYLEAAARVVDRPSAILSDLAAAFIERAVRAGSPRDLIEAMEAASGALNADSTNNDARFNLALAMQRLRLVDQATHMWAEYAKHESQPGRAAEANAQLRMIRETQRPPAPSATATAAEISRFVDEDAKDARLVGWVGALGDWGTGIVSGDTASARLALNLARSLGSELATRGQDRTLFDAVAVIDRVSPLADRVGLAQAHAAYAKAYHEYEGADYASARLNFASAMRDGGRSPTLAAWAGAFHGATTVYIGDVRGGEAELRRVASSTDTLRFPALAGRVHWMLGTTLLRTGRNDGALSEARAATRYFVRAKEVEHRGAAESLEMQARYLLGGGPDMYLAMARALESLAQYRGSVWLYTLLFVAALAEERDGLVRAAAWFQDEAVAVSVQTGQPIIVAEARISRARLALTMNAASDSVGDLAQAMRALNDVSPGAARDRVEANRRLTSATELMRREPPRALATLDSVVAFFRAPVFPAWLIPALTARAEVRLTVGDTVGGLADLRDAVAMLGAERDRTLTIPLRASFIDAARRVFDRLIMLEVRAGRLETALDRLEEARGLATAGTGIGVSGDHSLTSLPGVTVVDYALIGDTLLAWTLHDQRVNLKRSVVDRSRLTRVNAQTVAALEVGAESQASRANLEQLFEWLVTPIAREIGASGTRIVIVADGEINAVPFPALIDRATGRYLIQDHIIRSAGSLRAVVAGDDQRRHVRRSNDRVTFLAVNPAFDGDRHPELPQLDGAAAEVDSLARMYPAASKLAGPAADRSGLLAGIGRANVVHYAGHAILDDERPERSSLVLAPSRSAGDSDVLRAEELAGLDLSGVRLVVLSACQTLGSRAGHTRGLAGLADAFVSAGVGGVVGSQWRVDDRLTLDLMTRFHRAYRATNDPAAALQQAQLDMIASPSTALRSPSAWAGFRYVGH